MESRKLLTKIIGTTNTFSQRTLTDHFRGLLMSRIKDYISNVMVQQQRSFMEINSYLTDISENIKTNISEIFANYGMSIEEFFVESINIEEDDVYKKLRESMGRRAERKMEGYDYKTERGFDVAEAQAKNEGTSGNVAGMGIGLGVGMGAGQVMGGLMGQAMQPVMGSLNSQQPLQGVSQTDVEFGVLKPKPVGPSAQDTSRRPCSNCGKLIQTDVAFCNYCGNKVNKEVVCDNCKTKLVSGSLFCHVCGTPQKRGQES
jgi:membrane protease subunit (stomatin/prohibitin family)